MTDPLHCPHCARSYPSAPEQDQCIRLYGECIACHWARPEANDVQTAELVMITAAYLIARPR